MTENPNPSWTISIQPILTNGDSTKNGRYLTIGNDKVDTIFFTIDGTDNKQSLALWYQGKEVVNPYSQPILMMPIDIDYDIFNPISNSSLTFCLMDNADIDNVIYSDPLDNYNPFGDVAIARIADPILDLFRIADLITISLLENSASSISSQVVFYGSIEDVNIESSSKGTFINLQLGAIGNILNRSMLVNSTNEQTIAGTLAYSLAQPLQLGDLITQLIDETYISQLGNDINYYGGRTNNKNEFITTGKVDTSNIQASTGSGLNSKSYVFVSTPTMDNKLDVILQTLYSFNRIFYIDLQGNFTITPLQNYFNSSLSWKLDMSGNASNSKAGALDSSEFVPILFFRNSKTSNINNRVLTTLMQQTTQYVSTDTTGGENKLSVAQTIATPPASLFPREYDMVQSKLGVQTQINLQSINGQNVAQNGGLINTAIGITSSNIQGLYTKMVLDANANYLTTADKNNKYKNLKYMTSLYAARTLAENLKNSLLIEVVIPIKYTYLQNSSKFRDIPINQLVQMPSVNNKLFDGQQFMFCYGFRITVSDYQSLLTLKLCKPFTYTALWCDQAVLIDQTSLGASS